MHTDQWSLISWLFLTSIVVMKKWQYFALRPAMSVMKVKNKTAISLQLDSILEQIHVLCA